MRFYPRLKELREKNEMTQKEIAALIGLRQQHYFRYESGERDLSTDLLIKIADIHKTSIDYILGRTDDPTPPSPKT